jgi:hypothetical protein
VGYRNCWIIFFQDCTTDPYRDGLLYFKLHTEGSVRRLAVEETLIRLIDSNIQINLGHVSVNINLQRDERACYASALINNLAFSDKCIFQRTMFLSAHILTLFLSITIKSFGSKEYPLMCSCIRSFSRCVNSFWFSSICLHTKRSFTREETITSEAYIISNTSCQDITSSPFDGLLYFKLHTEGSVRRLAVEETLIRLIDSNIQINMPLNLLVSSQIISN